MPGACFRVVVLSTLVAIVNDEFFSVICNLLHDGCTHEQPFLVRVSEEVGSMLDRGRGDWRHFFSTLKKSVASVRSSPLAPAHNRNAVSERTATGRGAAAAEPAAPAGWRLSATSRP